MTLRKQLLIVLPLVLVITGLTSTIAPPARAVEGQADLAVAVGIPEDLDQPAAAPPPPPGSRQVFPVWVDNLDPTATATDVVLTLTISDQMTVTNIAGCTAVGQTQVCSFGDIPPNGEAQVNVIIEMADVLKGVVGITGSASSSSADPDESNNTGSWSHDYGEADLTTFQEVNGGTPGDIGPSGAVHLDAWVVNNGPSATVSAMTVTWSEGLTFVGHDQDCYDFPDERRSECYLRIEPGRGWHMEIDLQFDPGWTGPVTTTFTASSTIYDPNPDDNTNVLTFDRGAIDPDPHAHLALTNSGSTRWNGSQELIDWTLVTTNEGPAAAEGVVLTDTLPKSVTVVDLPDNCAQSRLVITCQLGELPVTTKSEIRITVQVNKRTKATTVTNVAQVTSTSPDQEPLGPVEASIIRTPR